MQTGSDDPFKEHFVDESTGLIPHRSTWDDLTYGELISLQALLEDQRSSFRSVPAIQRAIGEGLAYLEHLLILRSSGS